MEIGYTICFIQRGEELLLLNRNAPPVQGLWNGVGGKIEEGETTLSSVQREVAEETELFLEAHLFEYKGTISWAIDGGRTGGMKAFVVRIDDDVYSKPVEMDEGILAWKDISWVLSECNYGVSPMIPYYLHTVLNEKQPFHHHFTVHQGQILEYVKRKESMHVVVP
ncbi:NUDIX domain-containing protein [Halobacillus litoralis]|uniref:NUDIX domain-containing protein n=1 Tax=Halobacillus litoralis TaxID=45668 RepID=A0A845FD86_9BACI|nr:8-oxo-dGTP diphosphatase [Halobacillus litoralis]MYL72363.1 NUDIX domain-containing protein [Halobacillus litoralis]